MVNRSERTYPVIGEVYFMNFTGVGSEQSGLRPGIVFQNNIGNVRSPNIVALPLTSSIKRLEMPTHVLIRSGDSGLKYNSIAICENPERMSKERIGKYITTLPEHYMKEIAVAQLLASSAISFVDRDTLIRAWEKAARLNGRCRNVQ